MFIAVNSLKSSRGNSELYFLKESLYIIFKDKEKV